jgi:anti-anti-sigma factor
MIEGGVEKNTEGGVERFEGVPVARVVEDIDSGNAAAIHQQLADTLETDSLCLVVDLTRARYVDSAGLDMLLRLGERLDHRRATLLLVIPAGSPLMRLATIVGLPEAIAVHPRLEDALREAPRSEGPTA